MSAVSLLEQRPSPLLAGKTAVITGANRGIGAAILDCFATHGATIRACVRQPSNEFDERMQALQRLHDTQIETVVLDLGDAESVKQAARTITAGAQRVDILVNNAAALTTGLFQMTPVARMKELFDVNFFAQVAFTQMIAKAMMRSGGSIVNLSSSAAIEGNEGRAAYASSKAAVIAFTKVIARELARYKVRANVIAPGLTQTDMMEQSTSADALDFTLQRIAMNRVGDPQEIANVALFLASDLSSYMTGQVLRVDGGMLG